MKSAATIIHIKITVKTTDEKYYLVFGGEGGDKGVACWSGILADNCVRSPDTIKTDFKILSIIGKDDEEHLKLDAQMLDDIHYCLLFKYREFILY